MLLSLALRSLNTRTTLCHSCTWIYSRITNTTHSFDGRTIRVDKASDRGGGGGGGGYARRGKLFTSIGTHPDDADI